MNDDEQNKNVQKTVGYLEKRGKLKLISSWKKYWFVLEGHLLLYYGSKDEYDSLSPCKGSISLGPTCIVKPYSSAPIGFQIETRSTTVTLRADSINEQTKWMQAILTSLNQNQGVIESPTKLNHFRYSTEKVNMLLNNADSSKDPGTPKTAGGKKFERTESTLLDRLQKLGAKSYNDQILDTINAKSVKLKETPLSSPKKQKEKEEENEKIVMEDDDICVCEYAKKTKEETNNNWKLEAKEKPSRLTRQISLLSTYYSDSELYTEPKNADFFDQESRKLAERIEELQCSMEFVEEPNEYECENEVYCVPSKILNQNEDFECENEVYCTPSKVLKNTEDFECDNEVYCAPSTILKNTEDFECDNEVYCAPSTILKNSEDFECDNEVYCTPSEILKNQNEAAFECDNEVYCASRQLLDKSPIYAQPIKRTVENVENPLYAEAKDEGSSSVEIDKNSGHLYNVPYVEENGNMYESPSTLRTEETSKKMKKKRTKSEESTKKNDGFIQRLLKQAWKSDKSGDLVNEETDVDKTLVMLTNLQDMLEKKKTLIKAMAKEKKATTSHSSQDNPKLGRHESPDLLRDLNLDPDYCEVFDDLQNEEEDIYSEVVEDERRSRVLRTGRASGSKEPKV